MKKMTETTDNLESEDEKVMTWVGHLTEARSRLLKAFVFFTAAFLCVYPFSGEVLKYLMLPLAQAMKSAGGAERAIFTGVAEGFIVHLKVSAFSAAVVSFPFVAFQAWRFVAPALYPSERSFVKPLFFVSPLLFAAGACFVFYLIAPAAFKFLLSFQQLEKDALPIVWEARIAEYLSFVMTLILAFGASFQLPIVLVVLAKLGLITAQTLVSGRRYAIVLIFIVAAVLTPPDVISQFALACPLIFLYESSILSIRALEKKQK